jgi:hypothetical protein
MRSKGSCLVATTIHLKHRFGRMYNQHLQAAGMLLIAASKDTKGKIRVIIPLNSNSSAAEFEKILLARIVTRREALKS